MRDNLQDIHIQNEFAEKKKFFYIDHIYFPNCLKTLYKPGNYCFMEKIKYIYLRFICGEELTCT